MPKTAPIRTCVVCRKNQEKELLLRFVFDGSCVVQDLDKKHVGRGAYCHAQVCFENPKLKEKLARALGSGEKTKSIKKKVRL